MDLLSKRFVQSSYWSGRSSAYGTGDQLLGLLRSGWHIESIGHLTYFKRSRRVNVYSFELRSQHDMTVMHIIENPFITALVQEHTQQDVARRSANTPVEADFTITPIYARVAQGGD